MTPFRHPFQKLCCLQAARASSNVLLGATGPYICSFNLPEGRLLSRWPRNSDDGDSPDADAADGTTNAGADDKQRPKKRQKLSESHQSSDESVEIVSERVKGQRRKIKVVSAKLPNVSHLYATRDAKHVIAVTADDKCVRVFEVRENGRLNLLSERCMPKRLCTITLTPDQNTILAGDKFGDVYSLPLFIPEAGNQRSETTPKPAPEFKPSATELTVHTAGNLEALRQQREQKKLKPRKEGPNFELKLLLGHVSLLTDVAVAEIEKDGRMRQHILTADRDEHIRVSRGIPQTHIIEGYCSGHKEFVSRLCILPWQQSLLVAGSGEPSLKIYHWCDGQVTDEVVFEETVKQELSQNPALFGRELETLTSKLAVSGFWSVGYTVEGKAVAEGNTAATGLVVVGLEGLPLLLSYSVSNSGRFAHHQTIHLSGNALAVTTSYIPNDRSILLLVSVDTIHLPGSCKEYRSAGSPTTTFIQTFSLVSTNLIQQLPAPAALPFHWRPFDSRSDVRFGNNLTGGDEDGEVPLNTSSWSSIENDLNVSITNHDSATALYEVAPTPEGLNLRQNASCYSPLGEFLYGLENLRKKRGQEAVEVEQGEEDDGAEVPEEQI